MAAEDPRRKTKQRYAALPAIADELYRFCLDAVQKDFDLSAVDRKIVLEMQGLTGGGV